MINPIKHFLCCLFLLSSLGCYSNASLYAAQRAYKNNQFEQAASQINHYLARDKSPRNRLIAYLELGSIRLAQQQPQQAKEAFISAHNIIKQQDLNPPISISQEALANITNLNALTYKATTYDKIMLQTYLALINLQEHNHAAARAHLFGIYERQQEAVYLNAALIEKEAQKLKKIKHPQILALTDPDAQKKITHIYTPLDQYKPYANYVNPFSEFLQALYFLHAPLEINDIQRAHTSFRRLQAMTHNTYIDQDLKRAQNALDGIASKPTTYIILEAGTAPARISHTLSLPLFIVSKDVKYFSASFPKLLPTPWEMSSLKIKTPQQNIQTQTLCHMDNIIATQFKKQLPNIITKTLIASATKAAGTFFFKKISSHPKTQNLLEWVGIIYQSASSRADLRTWRSLPKKFEYAAFPTPTTRTITLSSSHHKPQTLSIIPGKTNVIYVKCIQPAAPLQITQFTLN